MPPTLWPGRSIFCANPMAFDQKVTPAALISKNASAAVLPSGFSSWLTASTSFDPSWISLPVKVLQPWVYILMVY